MPHWQTHACKCCRVAPDYLMASDGASDIVVVSMREMSPLAHMIKVTDRADAISAAVPVF